MGFVGLRSILLGMTIATGVVVAADARAADAEVTDIRVGRHGLSTRIVVDLDRPVAAKIFTLAGPARLVIDLPEVGWRLPPAPLPENIGVLARLRYGLFQPGNSRVVIDLNQPSRVHEAITLAADGALPDRLVIDLARVSGSVFLRSVEAPPMEISGENAVRTAVFEAPVAATPKLVATRTASPTIVAKVPTKPAAPAVNAVPAAAVPARIVNQNGQVQLASVRLPRKPAVPGGMNKRIIVIDPGHGGVDPGAIGVSGGYEKNITLAAARDLRDYLEGTGRFEVHLTRDRDIFIRLRGRIDIAREKKADLFLSVHADTIRDKHIRGLSVYTLSERASDKEAGELAERENKSDLIAGVDLTHESAEVTNILIDLAQRETMNQSARVASLLVRELSERVKILPNPHRFAGFAVLKAPDIPSVLIELGFLSNREDERALRSKDHRRAVAKSVGDAIDAFFAKTESASRL